MDLYMLRFIFMVIGLALLLFGIVGVLTPIPFGLFFIVLALLILIPTTPGVTGIVRKLRIKYGRFDRFLFAVSSRLPTPYRRIIKQTEIDELDRPIY
jgi:hypothetical protein